MYSIYTDRQTDWQDSLTFCPGCSFIFPKAMAGTGRVVIVTGLTPPPPPPRSWWSPPSDGQVLLTSAPCGERFPKRILGSIAVYLARKSVLFVCWVGWFVLLMKQRPAKDSNYHTADGATMFLEKRRGTHWSGWRLIDGFWMTLFFSTPLHHVFLVDMNQNNTLGMVACTE